jgi:hypothetical protein
MENQAKYQIHHDKIARVTTKSNSSSLCGANALIILGKIYLAETHANNSNQTISILT